MPTAGTLERETWDRGEAVHSLCEVPQRNIFCLLEGLFQPPQDDSVGQPPSLFSKQENCDTIATKCYSYLLLKGRKNKKNGKKE